MSESSSALLSNNQSSDQDQCLFIKPISEQQWVKQSLLVSPSLSPEKIGLNLQELNLNRQQSKEKGQTRRQILKFSYEENKQNYHQLEERKPNDRNRFKKTKRVKQQMLNQLKIKDQKIYSLEQELQKLKYLLKEDDNSKKQKQSRIRKKKSSIHFKNIQDNKIQDLSTNCQTICSQVSQLLTDNNRLQKQSQRSRRQLKGLEKQLSNDLRYIQQIQIRIKDQIQQNRQLKEFNQQLKQQKVKALKKSKEQIKIWEKMKKIWIGQKKESYNSITFEQNMEM